jgi:geranylgeranyl diphosphate synthase, type II
LSYSIFRDDPRTIIKPALAIEVFHNFTLMHDDIMDKAPLRRGKPTVHEKWNSNIAILSGDVMMVKAYEFLLEAPSGMLRLCLEKFNKCAIEVCEGQQKDMNFERQHMVTEEEYLDMIRLKTAVLLGFSTEIGAILAGEEAEVTEPMREFGLNIGLGFQLMDDLLDVYADPQKFGKQVGGDIVANKKTHLLIKALENATGTALDELQFWLQCQDFEAAEKVNRVKAIYDKLGIRQMAEEKMQGFFEMAFNRLESVPASGQRKEALLGYAKSLIDRQH